MSTLADLSSDEKRAYDLIVSRDGLLQSELWKELDMSSRKGSRLAKTLAEEGLIERKQTTANGRRTYLLTPTADQTTDTTADQTTDTTADQTTDTTADQTGGGTEVEPEPPASRGGSPSGDGLDSRERRALALINDRGGIYQSDFWKELDVSSRTGSRIATNLADAGLIRREEATYDGQRTYRLLPAKKELDFSLLMAGDMISPLVGSDEEVDPVDSDEFTEWVLQLARTER